VDDSDAIFDLQRDAVIEDAEQVAHCNFLDAHSYFADSHIVTQFTIPSHNLRQHF